MADPSNLFISETANLHDAIARLNACRTTFTVFAVDADQRVQGVLTRGDVVRHLQRAHESGVSDLSVMEVRQAMTPRLDSPPGPGEQGVLFVRANGERSWYEQISQMREDHRDRWPRVKLLPVLDNEYRLDTVLDLESPRTRSRLESLVMAEAFSLTREPDGSITDEALATRRRAFDTVYYKTHWQKVEGLCDLLLKKPHQSFNTLDDVFNHARADEIFHGLSRSEEWLKGHVSDGELDKDQQDALLAKIGKVKNLLQKKYLKSGEASQFPVGVPSKTWTAPEVIVVLGCTGEEFLLHRVGAAFALIRDMDAKAARPTLVLSGGGFGHRESEARRMLAMLRTLCRESKGRASLDPDPGADGTYTLSIGKRGARVLIEEDSLDTLGNAVLSWLTLKAAGEHNLTADKKPRLDRVVVVTDGVHAPRSYDVFRRVFAFREVDGREEWPNIVVRTARAGEYSRDEIQMATDNLRSEAMTNAEIYRLVNPLTNSYDVIHNGHIRSVLGQMLRLHKLYGGRWDLVRRYHDALKHTPPSEA